jgi:putative nucleotidyltransferase with HDIG domain
LGTPRKVNPPDVSETLVYPAGVRDLLRRGFLLQFYPLAGIREESAAFDGLMRLSLALARPNLWFDPDLTKERHVTATAAITPVTRTIHKDETIVERGTKPRAFERSVLDRYNARIQYNRVFHLLAYLLLTLGLLLFLATHMRRFRPLLRFRTSTIVIVGIPFLVVLVIGRAGSVLLTESYGPATGYLYPVALLGMLGVILLDTELAIIQVLIGSVLIGLATGMRFECALPALFGGMTAVGSLHRLRQRSQLFRAAIYVAVVNTVVIGLLRFIEDPDPTRIYLFGQSEAPRQVNLLLGAAAWGTINAALCYFLAIGMFPLFEGLFGITTDLKLLEMTGVHHPLLRELEEKAPGSYQHSLNVAKLAEAAADAIGANYLLVRAGAYFHDIGKTLKPRYFSENQISPDDRRTHAKLTPYMSCLIIRNHVKEGIELARRFGVPEKVVEFIPQHHGSCMIKYFYHEAIRQYEESESAEPVREEDFRYPGPKPQSIEAAIVMVADSVEATATNRLNRPHVDADDIRRLVIDAIQDKFGDGQFNDCHLTLRQLHEIRESMVRTLIARFHHRVDYPSPTAAPARRGAKDAAAA